MCIFICSPPCSPSFQLYLFIYIYNKIHFYRRICQKSLNPWSPTVIQWRTVEGYGEDGQTHIESEFDLKWCFLFIFGYRWTTVVFRRNGKRLSTFLWTRRGTVLSRVVAKSGNFEGPHCGEHDVREPLMQSSVWDLRWHYLPFKVLIENGKNKGELAMLVFVFDFFGHLRLHQNLLGAHEDLGHENPYGWRCPRSWMSCGRFKHVRWGWDHWTSLWAVSGKLAIPWEFCRSWHLSLFSA